jgi:hypothetical protein
MLMSFFRSWISRGGRSAGSARRRAASRMNKPRTRPTLEALEGRLVPTVVFTPQFGAETYTGAKVGTQNPAVHLIFSGDDWYTPSGRQDQRQIITATKNILSGPYLSELKQYGSDGKATYVDNWNTSLTVPSNPPTDSLQDLLQLSISVQSLIQGTVTDLPGTADLQHAPIYVLISDPTSSAGNNGGWNQQGSYTESTLYGTYNAHIHMIWIGTSLQGSSVSIDSLTLALSHELAETMSDPTGNGNITPPTTLPPSLAASGGNQVGDYEPEPANQPHYGYRLGAELVQPYWSKNDNAFIVPDGNAQKFYLQPVWSGTTFSGQYDLKVSLASNNDQIAINQSASPLQAGGVAVNLNSVTASFDAGAIRTINVSSGAGQHYVNVAGLPSDVKLNVTGGSAQSNDTVTIGSNGSLANISGSVNVSNTSGKTKLIVSDSSDSAAQYVEVTDNAVRFSGLAEVDYTGGPLATSGVTSLEVDGGHGGNLFNVYGTAAHTPLTINPGSQSYGVGSNTVNILGSSSAVTVRSSGNDSVVVGDGSLAGIGGPVNVSNASGADSLTINDSADSDARSIDITSNAVKFAATASAPAVTINYTPPPSGSNVGVNQLTIYDGAAANAIAVESVSPQAPVTIDGDTQDTLTGAAADQVLFTPVQM